MSLINTNYF